MRKTEEVFQKDMVSHVQWTLAVQRVEALMLAADNLSDDQPLDERMVAVAMVIKAMAILRGVNVVDLQDEIVMAIRNGKRLEDLFLMVPAGTA
jgi:hypothetical protein